MHIERGARVRFPFIKPENDSDGPVSSVVRVLTKNGSLVESDGRKVQVVLRHARLWHDALSALSRASDRSMSSILGRLIATGRAVTREGPSGVLPMEIVSDRGRPSTDSERTLNLFVERDIAMERAWTYDAIGEHVDQVYYLTTGEIAALERLSTAAKLSPGQVADVLIMRQLAKAGGGSPNAR